jgi:hypothetical protein
MMPECMRINGILDYCGQRDSYPAVDLYDNATRKRLICVRNNHPDSIGEQAEHIIRGVREGLADALVAAAPYLGPVTEGISCASGVVYACRRSRSTSPTGRSATTRPARSRRASPWRSRRSAAPAAPISIAPCSVSRASRS